MWNDPIVEEVRKNRQEIFAECDYDLHKLFEREQEQFPRLVEMGFKVYVNGADGVKADGVLTT